MIEAQDIEFVNTKFPNVEGWCYPEAAYMTLNLMATQRKLRLDSAILEIGVYKGKYLSVLYEGSKTTGQPVVGIDTFEWSSQEEVTSTFHRLFGSAERLTLVAGNSSRLEAAQVIELLQGKRPSLISVDGDHSAAGVRKDLTLSKQILSEGGMLAVDDFLNPMAISVSEGVYRFFLETSEQSLWPFLYCSNKLFCVERRYYEPYVRAVWELVESMPELAFVQQFKEHLQMGRAYVEQELLGTKVLIF